MRTLLIQSYIAVKHADPRVNLENNHFDSRVMGWVRKHSRDLYDGMKSKRVMALEDAEHYQELSQTLRAARRKKVKELRTLRNLIRSRSGGPVGKNSVHPPNTLLRTVPQPELWKRWTVQQLTDQFRLRNGARKSACVSLFDALKSTPDIGTLLSLRGTLRVTFKKDAALAAVQRLVEFESERRLSYVPLLEHGGDDSDTSGSEDDTIVADDGQAENERMEHEQERELEEKVHVPEPPDSEADYCQPDYCAYGRTSEGHMVQCASKGCRGNRWYHTACLPSWESAMATANPRQPWWCYDCNLRMTYRTRRKRARYVGIDKSWLARSDWSSLVIL